MLLEAIKGCGGGGLDESGTFCRPQLRERVFAVRAKWTPQNQKPLNPFNAKTEALNAQCNGPRLASIKENSPNFRKPLSGPKIKH